MKISIVEAGGKVSVVLKPLGRTAERVSEEDFEKLLDEYHALIKPIRDRRAREREEKRKLEEERKCVAAQRVIDINGVAIRVQKHYGSDMHHDTSAWRDGCDPENEDTLWVVRLGGCSVNLPWTIQGPVHRRRYDGYALRREVCGQKNALRFGSLEAAVKRALEIEIAGGFKHPGKIERPKPYA